MQIKTKAGLAAFALLLAAGGVATMNDEDAIMVQYIAEWHPAEIRAVTVQWGVRGAVHGTNHLESRVNRRVIARRGDVAFMFVQLPAQAEWSSYTCSVTVHGKTTTTVPKGERDCYVAVPV
jgi:hypothetical protein